MIGLLTSCNRPDLLKQTLESFWRNQKQYVNIILHEDGPVHCIDMNENQRVLSIEYTHGAGQHRSIEKFLKSVQSHKYFLHLEDDWEFDNSYDWLEESVRIMDADPSIIKVLARNNSPHPCVHNKVIMGGKIMTIEPETETGINQTFGYLEPWNNNGIDWYGFSWNPGVTRLDLLKQFVPFPKHEQYLSKEIYDKGYKVAELINPIYTHIGDGRSTHD